MTEYELAIRLFIDRLQMRVDLAPEALPLKAKDALIALSWARKCLEAEIKAGGGKA